MANLRKVKRMARTAKKHAQRRKYQEYAGTSPYVCLETPKRCSCLQCGNSRYLTKGKDKLTLQEKRALLTPQD